ncbi:hypothetical protein [Ornithinibacillus sp. JPR2-1]|uniref:hypothetical protein n=1 Tax=Ornithinibacillus sp. JPR2-1 TaxID=2094019 RepID=UPI0031D6AE00
MSISIYNCFSWIGYHYVHYFLEKGIEVNGIDKIDSEKKENLHMLVGRNSSFRLIPPNSIPKDLVALVIGGTELPIYADRIIQIRTREMKKKLSNAIVINAPILFGEWMEMTEEDIKVGNRNVRFHSREFQSDAIYIKDFVKATAPLFHSSNKPSELSVFSKKVFLNEAVKLENSIYIRDNIPIEENVRKVLAHYRRYKDLYEYDRN